MRRRADFLRKRQTGAVGAPGRDRHRALTRQLMDAVRFIAGDVPDPDFAAALAAGAVNRRHQFSIRADANTVCWQFALESNRLRGLMILYRPEPRGFRACSPFRIGWLRALHSPRRYRHNVPPVAAHFGVRRLAIVGQHLKQARQLSKTNFQAASVNVRPDRLRRLELEELRKPDIAARWIASVE
jgi:hypothetical protein